MFSAMPSPWCIWSKRAGSGYDMNFNAHQVCLAILCVHSDMGVQIWRLLSKPRAMLWNASKDCVQCFLGLLEFQLLLLLMTTWNIMLNPHLDKWGEECAQSDHS